MEPSHIAVATLTRAQSPADEAVLLRSIRQLVQIGMPVAVTDRGSGAAFTRALTSCPAITMGPSTATTLVGQVRTSLAAAAALERPFILYTESDKELFFGASLVDFIRHAPIPDEEPNVGVILACRSETSFATYPRVQQYTEGVINRLCAEATGLDVDYSYGPFLMNRRLLPDVLAAPDTIGWGWRHFVFRAAHRRGFGLRAVVGDYPCPEHERAADDDEDERTHRIRQLSQNLLGLIT